MPFTAHLGELRSCLINSCLALLAAFLLCFAFVESIIPIFTAPLLRIKVPGLTLIGTGITEAFFTEMKVAFVSAFFVSSPVILWQAWKFIAPGLYEHERRYTRQFVFFGTVFFLLGAWFCYETIFDLGYRFFLKRYEAIEVRPAIRIGEYITFSAKLMLAFGLTFELPVVAYFLARAGLIDHRFLIRYSGHALLLIFVLAAILTPPDVVSQILLSVPLLTLYGVSIIVAYFARKK